MEQPPIHYCKTADGVSIAFWTLGEGIPFVHMPVIPFNNLQQEWQIPDYRRWYERLAERNQLVRYDARGSGLSERNVTDFSLDAQVLDLEAVADRLGHQRFVLFGVTHAGVTAMAYAARHPDRVAQLVLLCS